MSAILLALTVVLLLAALSGALKVTIFKCELDIEVFIWDFRIHIQMPNKANNDCLVCSSRPESPTPADRTSTSHNVHSPSDSAVGDSANNHETTRSSTRSIKSNGSQITSSPFSSPSPSSPTSPSPTTTSVHKAPTEDTPFPTRSTRANSSIQALVEDARSEGEVESMLACGGDKTNWKASIKSNTLPEELLDQVPSFSLADEPYTLPAPPQYLSSLHTRSVVETNDARSEAEIANMLHSPSIETEPKEDIKANDGSIMAPTMPAGAKPDHRRASFSVGPADPFGSPGDLSLLTLPSPSRFTYDLPSEGEVQDMLVCPADLTGTKSDTSKEDDLYTPLSEWSPLGSVGSFRKRLRRAASSPPPSSPRQCPSLPALPSLPSSADALLGDYRSPEVLRLPSSEDIRANKGSFMAPTAPAGPKPDRRHASFSVGPADPFGSPNDVSLLTIPSPSDFTCDLPSEGEVEDILASPADPTGTNPKTPTEADLSTPLSEWSPLGSMFMEQLLKPLRPASSDGPLTSPLERPSLPSLPSLPSSADALLGDYRSPEVPRLPSPIPMLDGNDVQYLLRSPTPWSQTRFNGAVGIPDLMALQKLIERRIATTPQPYAGAQVPSRGRSDSEASLSSLVEQPNSEARASGGGIDLTQHGQGFAENLIERLRTIRNTGSRLTGAFSTADIFGPLSSAKVNRVSTSQDGGQKDAKLTHCEEARAVLPQVFKVPKHVLRVFGRLLDFSSEKTSRSEIYWPEVEDALECIGFSLSFDERKGYVRCDPPATQEKSVWFIRLKADIPVSSVFCETTGNCLNRTYGWNAQTFQPLETDEIP